MMMSYTFFVYGIYTSYIINTIQKIKLLIVYKGIITNMDVKKLVCFFYALLYLAIYLSSLSPEFKTSPTPDVSKIAIA